MQRRDIEKVPASNARVRLTLRRSLLLATTLLGAVLLIEWKGALSFLGGWLIDSESPRHSDLILVLGGDFWGHRVVKAAELGTLGYAPSVLISGPPYMGRPEGELAVDFLVNKGFRREMFAIFPHTASSTLAEALVLRGELTRRQAKQVILVTSNFHSRRAAIVFKLFCPGIRFISVPADENQFHGEGWWRYELSRQLFFSEWTKIFGTLTVAYPRYLVSRLQTWL